MRLRQRHQSSRNRLTRHTVGCLGAQRLVHDRVHDGESVLDAMIELVDQELTLALALFDGQGRVGERVAHALELRQGGRHRHDRLTRSQGCRPTGQSLGRRREGGAEQVSQQRRQRDRGCAGETEREQGLPQRCFHGCFRNVGADQPAGKLRAIVAREHPDPFDPRDHQCARGAGCAGEIFGTLPTRRSWIESCELVDELSILDAAEH